LGAVTVGTAILCAWASGGTPTRGTAGVALGALAGTHGEPLTELTIAIYTVYSRC